MSKFRFTPASLEWIKSKLPYGRVLKLTGSDFEGLKSLKYKFEIQELYMRKYIKLNGKNIFEIDPGMRIAQLIFMKLPEIELIVAKELDETDRGSGGFGSTGV